MGKTRLFKKCQKAYNQMKNGVPKTTRSVLILDPIPDKWGLTFGANTSAKKAVKRKSPDLEVSFR
jgi:hypothetical protein